MLAGGMVVAAPSMVPTAAAAGALYVSAENAQFDNLFGGPMVIEVIVKDPNRSATNENAAEPTVMVDNKQLRMAQGLDGNWYGYFADSTDVSTLVLDELDQLNWGTAGDISYGTTPTVLTTYDVLTYHTITQETITNAGVILGGGGIIDNPPKLSNWNSTNGLTCLGCGQIGITAVQWPYLQTFDFTIGDFDVVLEQAGTDEIVTLDHNNADLDDYSSLTLDRSSATQGADLHLFIVDQQLNIDPTDEDVVIFRVANDGGSNSTVAWTNGTLNYRLASTGFLSGGLNFSAAGSGHGFGDNGKLLINNDTLSSGTNILEKSNTDDDTIVQFNGTSGQNYFIFTEDADNSGTFSNVDDADQSSIQVTKGALRGTTATFDYNDSAQSFIVSNDFGTIDMDESSVGDEWNSGETLAVTIVDQDLNKNTLMDEDMTLRSHNTTIPALIIGSPITLTGESLFGAATMNVSAFNKIGTIFTEDTTTGSANSNVTITFPTTSVAQYRAASTVATFVFANYNVTEVLSETTGIMLGYTNGTTLLGLENTTSLGGLLQLDNTIVVDSGMPLGEAVALELNFTGTTSGTRALAGDTLYVDIFTYGDRVNNAIYRLLLEETGDNTATFIGEVEFIMLNQLNVDVSTTFSTLTTISDDITIIVHEDLTDEDSPRINYLDLGADGVSTQIADQVAAPSHSGVVTLDSANYKIADTVVVTLNDQDMNTDSDLIDVYITKSTDDKVGNGGTDHVLDITFNDAQWKAGAVGTTAGSPDNGLAASGFTLVETGVDSGLFTGSFQVPSTYWNDATGVTETLPVTTTGTDIEVNYNDHRDASGETIEVGAGASINANTGSVEFDRTVYPVPWGNTTTGTAGDERFALHASASDVSTGVENALAQGDVNVHIRITDADYDLSASGEDSITDGSETGSSDRVVLKIERGSNSKAVAQFGNSTTPILETSPSSGVFEYDQLITFTDGPDDDSCPAVFALGCVLQGDILTVTYNDVKCFRSSTICN